MTITRDPSIQSIQTGPLKNLTICKKRREWDGINQKHAAKVNNRHKCKMIHKTDVTWH